MLAAGSPPPRGRRAAAAGAALLLLGLIPVALMVARLAGGTRLQYADYWVMLDRLLTADGGIRPLQLFTFHNEHPVFFAQVLYLANARVFGGSNLTQGVVVVAIGATQAVLIWMLARSTFPDRRIVAGAIGLVSLAAVFAPRGSWVYVMSMSGAAWLPANVFAIMAIFLTHRSRRWPAAAAAVAATISYGTGWLAWPAMAVTSMIRERRWRPPPETIVGTIVSAVWMQSRAGVQSEAVLDDELGVGVASQVKTLFTLVGYLVPGGGTAWQWIGALVLLSGLSAAVVLIRRTPECAPYVGVFLYSFAALALIARGRATFMAIFGIVDRYACLSALVWLSTFALLVLVAFEFWPAHIRARWATIAVVGVAVGLTVAMTLGGRDATQLLEDRLPGQNRLEVAIRFGLADDRPVFGIGPKFPVLSERLAITDHFPFGASSFHCGLADTRFRTQDAGVARGTASMPSAANFSPQAVTSNITLAASRSAIECVIATDDQDVVVGAAYPTDMQPAEGSTYMAVAKPSVESFFVVMRDGSTQRIEVRDPG